ncbi:hypothetical protein D3C76_1772200 [compost metagenome]
MIGLGEVHGRRLVDLGGDRAETGLVQLGLVGRFAGLCLFQLLRAGAEDRRAVLGADVVALAHTLGGVV